MLLPLLFVVVVFVIDPKAIEIPPFNEGVFLVASGLALLGAWIASPAQRRTLSEPLGGPLLPLACWLGLVVVTNQLLPHPLVGWPLAASLLAWIGVTLLARTDADHSPLKLPGTMVWAGSGVALIAIAQALGHDPLFDNPQGEAVSVFGNTNLTGQFLAPLIPLALVLQGAIPGWRGGLNAVAVPLLVCGMILSGSRAALVATLAGLVALALCVPFFGLRTERTLSIRGGVLLLAGGLLAIGVAGSDALSFKQLEESDASITSLEYPTNRQRLLLATATLKMIDDRPWLGHGPNAFRAAFPPYRSLDEAAIPTLGGGLSEAEDPHNQYLLLLAEGGWLTLLLFASFALTTLVSVRYAALIPAGDPHRLIAPGLAAAFTSLLVVSAFRSTLEHAPTALLLFIVAGSLIVYRGYGEGRRGGSLIRHLVPLYFLGIVAVGLSVLGSNLCVGLGFREVMRGLETREYKTVLQADQYFEWGEALQPNNIYLLQVRASMLDRLGMESPKRLDDAAAIRRRTLAYYPWSVAALSGLALWQLEKGKITEAESTLRRIRSPGAPDPKRPESMIQFLRARQRSAALAPYLVTKVRAGDVSLSELSRAADQAFASADVTSAIACLNAFLELRPYQGEIAFKLAEMQSSIGKSDLARMNYHRAHIGFALQHLAARDYAAARESINLAARRAETPASVTLSALVSAAGGDDTEMDQLIAERTFEFDPPFVNALRDLAGDNPSLRSAINALTGS